MPLFMLACCRWMHQTLGWQPAVVRGVTDDDGRHCLACGRWWFWMDGAWWPGTVEAEV